LLPLIDNENRYFVLRQKLLAQPTAKQTQVDQSAARVSLVNHDPNVGNVNQKNERTMPMAVIETNQKFISNLFIHCKHEARLNGMARDIHVIHDSFFKDTPTAAIRLIVGHRNNPNIELELSQKCPSLRLLKDPSSKPKSKPNEARPTTE
ncbi:unnamed protein product, partial [Rotaria sp. Silwood2]